MAVFPFWSKPVTEIAQSVNSSITGLSEKDAQAILRRVGPNRIQAKKRVTPLGLFLNQFKSLIVLILIFATLISAFLQDWADAAIILLIVMGSALLSFFQEYNANTASEKLKEQVSFNFCAVQFKKFLPTVRGSRASVSIPRLVTSAPMSSNQSQAQVLTPFVTLKMLRAYRRTFWLSPRRRHTGL
jgi:magnesium-transporting ATPase (P-type)